MVKKWQFLLLTALGGIALVLVTGNLFLHSANRTAQQAFSARAQFIQQSQQIQPVYQGIIRMLAELAAKSRDEQIRQLLASQGISYTVNPVSDAKSPPDADSQAQASPGANTPAEGGQSPAGGSGR